MPKGPPNMRNPWLRRLLVAAGTILALGLLLEIGFRAFVPPHAAPPLRFEFSNRLDYAARSLETLFQDSPTRFWELAPGRIEPFGGDRINSLGLRGPEPSTAPVFRVAVLGDSCTYGIGNGYPHTYGARVEARLRALLPGRSIEVVNGGVPGYTLAQGVRLFEELVAPLRPEVVVLYYGAWNDFGAAIGESDLARLAGAKPTTLLQDLYEPLSGLRAVQWLGGRYASALRHRQWRATVDAWLVGDPPDGYRVPPIEFEMLLEGLLARCEELGSTPVIVLPELDVTRPEGHEICYGRVDAYRELLARAAERHGLATVDMRALFPREQHARLFVDRVHPGPLGHLWLGNALAARIAALECCTRAPRSDSTPMSPIRLGELALDPHAGGTLTVRVDLGNEHARAEVRLLAACAPKPYEGQRPAPAPPLLADEVTAFLTPPATNSLVLDDSGRGEARIVVPPDLAALRGESALGVALARRSGNEEIWLGEAWLALEPVR